jgi:N-acetylglucosaminyldiphosphoundecaprenol N-acetyl-beta-D-mannosaminyltransferase
MLRHLEVLGYSILDEPAGRVAAAVCDELDKKRPKSFVFLNPHSVVVASREPKFRNALTNADGVFCDGVGLSIAARVLKRRKIARVYGFEFFMALSRELSARRTGRVFFLGGTDESLAHLAQKFQSEFPGIAEVGFYAPPYRPEFSVDELREMAARIDEFGADILWVGLGSPKQEKILFELTRACKFGCGAAIGAVFDFYTGRISHAPAWVRRLGLQWAHRLALEPRRLWKRTLISTPVFLWLVLLDLSRVTRRA